MTLDISTGTLMLVVVQLIAFVYGYARLVQKVDQINGEVRYVKRYRQWMHGKLMVIFDRHGINTEDMPQ